ncbi:major allergen Dau c 1-like [Triticum dicoccoides]|uniref:major allergen Dau c 1-like n=1 Tax=Triticum dicoccoides TaxID=85692 RepID=UPI00188EC18D|nr:major allergen Dau c 1-like [Triticum dicoccoides]
MVAGCVITDECALAVSTERMWKVVFSGEDTAALPKACAGFIDAVDVEGDGGPGSVSTMTLSPAAAELAGSGLMRTRLVARDNVARVIKTEVLDSYCLTGSKVSGQLKSSQVAEVKLEVAGEGACVAKLRVEYERLDGSGALSAEDQAALVAGYLDLLKMVEAYLVAHPAEYA